MLSLGQSRASVQRSSDIIWDQFLRLWHHLISFSETSHIDVMRMKQRRIFYVEDLYLLNRWKQMMKIIKIIFSTPY